MHTLYLHGLPTNIPLALRVDEANQVYIVQLYTQITLKQMWQQISQIRGDQIWAWILLQRIAFYCSIRKLLPQIQKSPSSGQQSCSIFVRYRLQISPRRWTNGLTYFVNFFSFFRQVPNFKLGHDRFSPSPFQFIIPILRRNVVPPTNSIVKQTCLI